MLLHFVLVLHFAAILITFCVNITFCSDYYISRRNTKASVNKKTRIRDGQRTIAKRLPDQVKQRLNDESEVSDRQWGKESLKALQKKVDALKKLDNQILDLIGSLDSEDLDVLIQREIEESDRFRGELNQVLLRLEEVLNPSMH